MKKSILVTAISLATVSQIAFAQSVTSSSLIQPAVMSLEVSASTIQVDTLKNQLKVADATTKLTADGRDATVITNIINEAAAKLKADDKKLEFAKLILRSAYIRSDEAYAKQFLAHFKTLGLFEKEVELTYRQDKNDFLPGFAVQVNPAIINNTVNEMTNARIEITPSSNIEVDFKQLDFGLVNPFLDKTSNTPLNINIPKDATCGEELYIDFTYSGTVDSKKIEKQVRITDYIGEKSYFFHQDISEKIGQPVKLNQVQRSLGFSTSFGKEVGKDYDEAVIVRHLDLTMDLILGNPNNIASTDIDITLTSPKGTRFAYSTQVHFDGTKMKSVPISISSLNDNGTGLKKFAGEAFSGEWQVLIEPSEKSITGWTRNTKIKTVNVLNCPTKPEISFSTKLTTLENKKLTIKPEVNDSVYSQSELTYSWKRVDSNKLDMTIISTLNKKDFEFIPGKVDKDTTVELQLTVRNPYGIESSENVIVQIENRKLPKVEALPTSIELDFADWLQLEAKATNPIDGELTYEWELDGKVIGDTRHLVYIFPTKRIMSFGVLKLTVTNKHGSTILMTAVTAEGFSDIIDQPTPTSTTPRVNNGSSNDGGGSLFYMIAGLLGLLHIRRRS